MSNLLIATMGMMGVTFIIGFFVAAIIKMIANWADLFDFWRLHREEILNMKREHKVLHRRGLSWNIHNIFISLYRKLVCFILMTRRHWRPRKRMIA